MDYVVLTIVFPWKCVMQPVVTLPVINISPHSKPVASAVQQHLQHGNSNWVTWTTRLKVESQDGGRKEKVWI